MIPTKDFEVGHNTTPTPLSSTNSDLYDFSPSSNGNQSALQHNYESDTEDSNHNSESPVCDGQFEEYEKNGWPPGWNHTAIGVSSPCALSLSDRSTPLTEAATFRNRGGKGQGLMNSSDRDHGVSDTELAPTCRIRKRQRAANNSDDGESGKENVSDSSRYRAKRPRKKDHAARLLQNAVDLSQKAVGLSKEAISLSEKAICMSKDAAGLLGDEY